jgi:hypothetical protein
MSTKLVLARRVAALMAITMAALALVVGGRAQAALVAAVPLGTVENYSVLAGSTVTNDGDSVLNLSLGLWDGTSITGFPPGTVVPPATIDIANGPAQQAQADLTVAYVNAHDRPIDATTTADLGNLILQPGVYAADEKGELGLTGPLVLDGANDLRSVFIFQTDSALTTAANSTVSLINGAQECNVFWQIGSSATLGADSVFVGNLMALTSITVGNSVEFHGRALARNAAVTLDDDTFTKPTCETPPEETPTTLGETTTTLAGETTTTVPETTTTLAETTTTVPETTTTLAETTTTVPETTTTVPETTVPETTTTQAEVTTTTTQAAPGTTLVSVTVAAPTTTSAQTASTSQPASGATTTNVAETTTSLAQTGVTSRFAAAVTTIASSGSVGGPTPLTELPETGSPLGAAVVLAALALIFGTIAVGLGQDRERAT